MAEVYVPLKIHSWEGDWGEVTVDYYTYTGLKTNVLILLSHWWEYHNGMKTIRDDLDAYTKTLKHLQGLKRRADQRRSKKK